MFGKGHIPGSIFVGLNGGFLDKRDHREFARCVGLIIKDNKKKILIVCEEGT